MPWPVDGACSASARSIPDSRAIGPSFQAAHRACAARLWAYVARTSGRADLADDITQEAFLRLLRAQLPERSVSQLSAYLFRTATNLMNDEWRRARRDAPEWDPDPRAEPTDLDLASDVQDLLDQIPRRDRQLLWLAHVEGYSHQEIAHLLALAPGSIKVLLFRARKRASALALERGLTGDHR